MSAALAGWVPYVPGPFDPAAAAADPVGPNWPLLLALGPSQFDLVRQLVTTAYEQQTRDVIRDQQVQALLRRNARARAELEGVRG